MVEGTASENGGLVVFHGPLHGAFAAYFVLCSSYGLYLLTRKIDLHGAQVKYVFLGASLAGLGATTTNLVIPFLFGTSRFSQYGPLFSLIMVAMIAHAIIRHRLMDIRVVIRKGVVYIVAFLVAGTLLAGLIVGSNLLFPAEEWQLGRQILLSLLVAVLFHPLKAGIQRAFDKYLYREPYDYQQVVREASQTMTTLLDLRPLLHYVADVIGRTVRPDRVSVYLRDREGAEFRHTLTRAFGEEPPPEAPPTLGGDSALGALLVRDRAPVVRDDLRRDDLDPDARAGLEALAGLGGEVALPLLKEGTLAGLLLVGAKRSGDPYFRDDLNLLSTLGSQAAIAVTNARLYEEVVLVSEYMENILKTMESGVIAAGVDGRVTLFNPAAERLTGRAPADVRARPVGELPGALADLLGATLADGVPRLQVEATLAGATGEASPVVCSTSSFADLHGRVLGAVLVFSDLTRIKELEGEKRRAERLAAFKALASGVAHEIKNPLVAIKTFAQLLPKKFAEEEFRRDFARVATREIDRINDLVERLRVAAAPSLPFQPLDLRDPMEEMLALLRGQLEERRVRVHRRYDEALPAVMGEPAQLKQLFLNLLLNALEAMEPGGTLTVGLRRLEGNGAGTVLVEVEDTGAGIPEDLLEKVFDPFFSTKPRGTGIGLAICRGIADAHRASIRAANNAGRPGATVSVVFPATRVPAEART